MHPNPYEREHTIENLQQAVLHSLCFLDILGLLEPIERFTNDIKRITTSPSLDFPRKMTMIQEAYETLLREVKAHFEILIKQLEERKKELQMILNPPRPDLVGDLQHLLAEVAEVAQKVSLREELMKRWEAQSPEEIVRAYENSIAAGETAVVEMFEAYAENTLERKGNQNTVAAFRERRACRLTPEQWSARRELQELERLGTSLHATFSNITSIAASVKSLMASGQNPVHKSEPPNTGENRDS